MVDFRALLLADRMGKGIATPEERAEFERSAPWKRAADGHDARMAENVRVAVVEVLEHSVRLAVRLRQLGRIAGDEDALRPWVKAVEETHAWALGEAVKLGLRTADGRRRR